MSRLKIDSSCFEWLGHCGRAQAFKIQNKIEGDLYYGFVVVSGRTKKEITFLLDHMENEVGIFYSQDDFGKKGKYKIEIIF